MFARKNFQGSAVSIVSCFRSAPALLRSTALFSCGLLLVAVSVGCGGKHAETESSSNEEQVTKSSESADRPVQRSFVTEIKASPERSEGSQAASASGDGSLEPGCVASIRYLANIARTMDEAIREYGAQNRGAKLDSLVETKKAVTVVLTAEYLGEFKNQDTIGTASAPAPSVNTSYVKNVNTTVKVGINITIPTGPDTTSTYITALKSPEGSLFINSFYANASVLNGLRKSCKGLGIESAAPTSGKAP